MNQFMPITEYLRHQLRRTCFEEAETFKQLLLLERLTLMALRDWRGEVVFQGLRALFPIEARKLEREVRYLGNRYAPGASPCLDWEQFASRPSEGQRQLVWRERVEWMEAGGRL